MIYRSFIKVVVGPANPCILVVQGFFAIEPQCKIHNLQNLKGHRNLHHRCTNDSLRGITWWFTMSPCNFELVMVGRSRDGSRFMPCFYHFGMGNRNWIQITWVIGYNEVYIQTGYSMLQYVGVCCREDKHAQEAHMSIETTISRLQGHQVSYHFCYLFHIFRGH